MKLVRATFVHDEMVKRLHLDPRDLEGKKVLHGQP
jgi:hypothetical protein